MWLATKPTKFQDAIFEKKKKKKSTLTVVGMRLKFQSFFVRHIGLIILGIHDKPWIKSCINTKRYIIITLFNQDLVIWKRCAQSQVKGLPHEAK